MKENIESQVQKALRIASPPEALGPHDDIQDPRSSSLPASLAPRDS
jgi:hypothetical protein